MNQKTIQMKQIKIEKQNQNSFQNNQRQRVRTAFNEITNIGIEQIKDKTTYKENSQNNNKVERQIQKRKRRNALIPIVKEHQQLSIDNLKPDPQPYFNYKELPETLKPHLIFSRIYESEFQTFELQYEQNFKEQQNVCQKHEFEYEDLEKAIDWMVYKMIQFRFTTFESIFQAIMITYQYLQNTCHLQFQDLELITGVCAFLCSKYYDIFPILIDELEHQFFDNKYSQNDIKDIEKKICIVIGYNFNFETPLYIVYTILLKSRLILEQYYDSIQIQLLTQKIIQNLLCSVIGQNLYNLSPYNKAIASILLAMYDNVIVKRAMQEVLVYVSHIPLNINQIEQNVQRLSVYKDQAKERILNYKLNCIKY